MFRIQIPTVLLFKTCCLNANEATSVSKFQVIEGAKMFVFMLKQALSNPSNHLLENRIYQKKSFLSEIENNVGKCFVLSFPSSVDLKAT